MKQGKIGHIFWLLWMFCLSGFVFSKVSSEMNNMGLPNTYLLVSGLSLITMLSVILGFEFTRHHKKLEKGEGIEVSFPDVALQELLESVLRFISIALGFAIIIDYGGLGGTRSISAVHFCLCFCRSADGKNSPFQVCPIVYEQLLRISKNSALSAFREGIFHVDGKTKTLHIT